MFSDTIKFALSGLVLIANISTPAAFATASKSAIDAFARSDGFPDTHYPYYGLTSG